MNRYALFMPKSKYVMQDIKTNRPQIKKKKKKPRHIATQVTPIPGKGIGSIFDRTIEDYMK